ncbi:hypothetical protein O6H91_14G027900 [Diphasiastrum complanatum]|uniref:Uncharacterized protein n=1 Tax=Diphasiastrum complanatum TaxID=34168 RepID=A0ACC2BMM8_DIPCM|nr:hypothetical protein O6H91_14G027900 [Diphasiastrum complanatum]
MAAPRVSLDSLPMKRLFSLEEAGSEHFPPEQTQEEKPLALLQRIDFSRLKEKDSKRSKSSKDNASQPATAWPWQGLVEHLQQAQQELSIILDLISHIEANEVMNVANMVRPKLLPPQELCSDLAVRVSSKLQHFHDVGNYLKKTAKALERQVEREAVFYGALMRLQLNWKVKRQKGISVVSGGSAGFTLDLSLPNLSETSSASSVGTTSLCTINVDQDSSGLLLVCPPSGRSISALKLTFGGLMQKRLSAIAARDLQTEKLVATSEAGATEIEVPLEKGVVKGVEKGAKGAHSVLRNIQAAVYDEQVFECVSREALLPSPALHVIGICNSHLQLSLNHTASVVFELSPNIENKECMRADDMNEQTSSGNFSTTEQEAPSKTTEDSHQTGAAFIACNPPILSDLNQQSNLRRTDSEKFAFEQFYPKDKALKICLQQAFYQNSFGRWIIARKSEQGNARSSYGPSMVTRTKEPSGISGVGAGKELLASSQPGLLRNFSAIIRHRKFCAEVLLVLEKQVHGIQHLHLYFHPTWNPCVSAWEICFNVPTTDSRGWTKHRCWSGEKEVDVIFSCTIVVRDESLCVEGLEGLLLFENPAKEKFLGVHSMTKYACSQSELPVFLLHQVAGKVVDWLYEEATVLGLNVKREFLGVILHLANGDDIAVVACPDVNLHVINWWIKSKVDLEGSTTNEKPSCRTIQRFIGPKPPEVLRSIIIEILNSSGCQKVINSLR